jgi:hypothetical protein
VLLKRPHLILSSLVVAAFVTGRAHSQDVTAAAKDECFRAVDDGQKLRTARKLVAARDKFIECARPVCPALIRKDCAEWLSEAQATMPSVVFGATDASGKDILNARVLVDGVLLTDKLDGSSVFVDPGPHDYRFEWPGHGSVAQPIVIREGEKSRLISVKFPPEEATAGLSSQKRSIPAGVFVFGGLAIAGFAGFTGFYLSSDSDVSHLRSTCAPTCPSSDVDSVRTRLTVSYVSLGVGIASAGFATTWFFFSRGSKKESAALSVVPAPGGGSASLRVSY